MRYHTTLTLVEMTFVNENIPSIYYTHFASDQWILQRLEEK